MNFSEEGINGMVQQFGKKPYPRPEGEEYPKVWLRFSGRPDGDGKARKFRIQDFTEEYFDAVNGWIQPIMKEEKTNNLLKTYEDETLPIFVNINWKTMMIQKVSVICVTDDEAYPTMAGFNFNEIVTKEEAVAADQQLLASAFLPEPVRVQAAVINDLKNEAKLFERFQSDRYMDAMGLFVLPDYRRNGIAEKLLEARIPLCKMLGIKGTANTFSSGPVRRVATKAGFEVYGEISMAEIGKKLGRDLPEDEFVKLMGIKID